MNICAPFATVTMQPMILKYRFALLVCPMHPNEIYIQLKKFLKHLNVHHAVGSYYFQCDKCKAYYRTHRGVANHYVTCKGKREDGTEKVCSICEKICASQRELFVHKAAHHALCDEQDENVAKNIKEGETTTNDWKGHGKWSQEDTRTLLSVAPKYSDDPNMCIRIAAHLPRKTSEEVHERIMNLIRCGLFPIAYDQQQQIQHFWRESNNSDVKEE